MATLGITHETNLPRITQLRWLLYIFAFAALAEAGRSWKHFYMGAHWLSLTLEILKTLLVFMVVGMNFTRNQGGQGGTPSNLTALKIGIFAMLISFLTDQALLQTLF